MKKFKSFLFVFLLMLIVLPGKVFAASPVTFALTDGPGTVKIGQQFTFNVKETGANDNNATLSSYTIKINYDASVIQYDGGGSSANGNEIIISGGSQTGDSTVATLKFTALAKTDSTNISIATANCNINGEDTTCEKKSSSVKVVPLGTDATLSGLSIPNTTLSPAFNKNVRDYSCEVKDVTTLTVNATASDPNAKIQISDNYKNLQKGENTISVVVNSEDGKKKTTYTIKVNLTLTPTEEELMKANADLATLEIKGQKLEFNSAEVKYYLDVPYNITSLEITPTAVNPNAQIQVNGNDKLIVGKNTINIVVTAEDTTTTKTYSILVTRLPENKKIIKTCPDSTSTKEWIIFSIGLFLMFSLGIVLGYILGKKDVLKKIFKKKNKEDEAVEIQTLSDTIDLGETIEELKEE